MEHYDGEFYTLRLFSPIEGEIYSLNSTEEGIHLTAYEMENYSSFIRDHMEGVGLLGKRNQKLMTYFNNAKRLHKPVSLSLDLEAYEGRLWSVLQADSQDIGARVQQFNATVLGLHGYYKIASHISKDFAEIAFHVNKSLYCRTKCIRSKRGNKSRAYERFYGKCKVKPLFIQRVALYPIHYVQTTPPVCFSQDICNYTVNGREKIHKYLQNFSYDTLQYIMKNPVQNQSLEYNDNRISLYVGQRGRCFITGEKLKILLY